MLQRMISPAKAWRIARIADRRAMSNSELTYTVLGRGVGRKGLALIISMRKHDGLIIRNDQTWITNLPVIIK